jgi:hypothetical protein
MASSPLVLVDGPPRCGKSTAARQLASSSSAGAVLARAGSPEARSICANPLQLSAARPVILDGATLDEARSLERILAARQERLPRFVLFGGPFGRPRTTETHPATVRLSLGTLTLAEVGRGSVRTHWLRGGFPGIYTAGNDTAATANQVFHIAGLTGGLLSPWGLPASPTRLATLLAGLANCSDGLVNESRFARMLGTSRPTVCRWMERLEQAGILRQVPRLQGTRGARRSIQAPAWYLRDSGLVHGLVGIGGATDLLTMPRLAAISWQAYVLEQTSAVIGPETELYSYLSADGACIELVLKKEDRILAAATRLYLPGSPGKGARLAAQAVGASECRIVLPDVTPRKTGGPFKATGLAPFLDDISAAFG